MRVIHRERVTPEHTVVPLCGEWVSLDEDWTDVDAGVTCAACRAELTTAAKRPREGE